MLVPNRHSSSDSYRYGFNGKEKDDEIKGEGVQYDYGFRIYDARIARFLSMDPLFAGYPYYTPYQFAGNRPIWAIDLDGLEEKTTTAKNKVIIKSTIYNHNNKLIEGSLRLYNTTSGGFETVNSNPSVITEGTSGGNIVVFNSYYKREPRIMFENGKRVPVYTRYGSTIDIIGTVPSDPNDNSKPMTNDDIDGQKSGLGTVTSEETNDNAQKDSTPGTDQFEVSGKGGSVNVKMSFVDFNFEDPVGKLRKTNSNSTNLDRAANTLLNGNFNLTITINVPTPPVGANIGRFLTKQDVTNYNNIFKNQSRDVRDELIKRGVPKEKIKIKRNTTSSSPSVNFNFTQSETK